MHTAGDPPDLAAPTIAFLKFYLLRTHIWVPRRLRKAKFASCSSRSFGISSIDWGGSGKVLAPWEL